MSVVYTADIYCDGEGCTQVLAGSVDSVPPNKNAARQKARENRVSKGWTFRSACSYDYCPDCTIKYGVQGRPQLTEGYENQQRKP